MGRHSYKVTDHGAHDPGAPVLPTAAFEMSYVVVASVAPQDRDLLDRVPDQIRARFSSGTAIRIIECEPLSIS